MVFTTRDGAIPNGSIENGVLHIDRLTAKPALGADELLFDLYRRMPAVRITDILIEIDDAIGFTDAFTHLRTGASCKDKLGLLNVLLGEGAPQHPATASFSQPHDRVRP